VGFLTTVMKIYVIGGGGQVTVKEQGTGHSQAVVMGGLALATAMKV